MKSIRHILSVMLAVSVFVTAGTAWAAVPDRKIADRMAPAVNRPITTVLFKIQLGGKEYNLSYRSFGTGFFVTPNGVALTNAHVVADYVGKDSEVMTQRVVDWLVDQGINDKAKIQSYLGQVKVSQFERSFQVLTPWGDVFPAKVLKSGSPIGTGNSDDVAVFQVLPNEDKSPLNFVTLPMGKATDLRQGQRVYLLGYPGVADSAVLDNKFSVEPTFTIGNVGATDKTVGGRPTPQLNIEANHGNSGGPLVDEKGIVHGQLTFGDGGDDSNINWAMPAELGSEFLKAVGATPSDGDLTKMWVKTIDAFYSNDLSGAASNLNALLKAYPNLGGVPNIKKMAEDIKAGKKPVSDAEAAGGGSGGGGGGMGAILGVVAFLGVVALGAFLYMRTKKEDPNAPIPAAGQIVFDGGPLAGRPIPLTKSTVIGRDSTRARVVVNDAQVSGAHCELQYTPGGVMLKDLASTNGTFVNGNRVSERLLKYGDSVSLGGSPMATFIYQGGRPSNAGGTVQLGPSQSTPAPQPRPNVGPAPAPQPSQPRPVVIQFDRGPLAGQSFPIVQPVTIGRDPARASIVVQHALVSGAHCEIHPTPQGLMLIDRGSTNGTFVAGSTQRATQQPLRPGERVSLGGGDQVSFVVVG